MTIDPRQIKVVQGSQAQVCHECGGFVRVRRSDVDRLPPTDVSAVVPPRPPRLRVIAAWGRATWRVGKAATQRAAISGRDKLPGLARAATSGSARALNGLLSRPSGSKNREADETDRAESNEWMSQAVNAVDSDLMLKRGPGTADPNRQY